MLSGFDELQKFLDKSATAFYRSMRDIFYARYGEGESNHAIHDMAKLISQTMILANMNARKRVLMEADQFAKRPKFSVERSPISPLPFVEAIEDIVSRDPRLAFGYAQVQKLYNTEHVFALAKSVNSNLTKRIQSAIAESGRTGSGLPEFSALWKEITPWAQSYGDTVFRTNASTSYTEGRFTQAEDPDVQEVIPAMTFINMHLPASRPWHEAADGLIAATGDPIWNSFKPPLGYNCQCGTNFVSKYELERRGLWKDGKVVTFYPPNFAAAHPDEGFNSGGWTP
jgi:hypothetical protein